MDEILVADVRFTVLDKQIGVRSGIAAEWVKRTKTKATFRDPAFAQEWLRERVAHLAADFYLRNALNRPKPTSIAEWDAEKPIYDDAVRSARQNLESINVIRLARNDEEFDKRYFVEQKFSLDAH